jgi:hypothetical protein
MHKMDELKRLIKALGEIVIRVKNLQTMQEFYENVIGLEILGRFDDSVFFKVAPSYGFISRSWGCSMSRYRLTIVRVSSPDWMLRKLRFIISLS